MALKQKTEKITGCQLLELGIVARKDSFQRSEQPRTSQAAWLVQKEPKRKELYHSNVLIIKMINHPKTHQWKIQDVSGGRPVPWTI